MAQIRSGTLAERYQDGVRLRRKTSREKHADLRGATDRDAVAILRATDRTRVPELVPVRYVSEPVRFPSRRGRRSGRGSPA